MKRKLLHGGDMRRYLKYLLSIDERDLVDNTIWVVTKLVLPPNRQVISLIESSSGLSHSTPDAGESVVFKAIDVNGLTTADQDALFGFLAPHFGFIVGTRKDTCPSPGAIKLLFDAVQAERIWTESSVAEVFEADIVFLGQISETKMGHAITFFTKLFESGEQDFESED